MSNQSANNPEASLFDSGPRTDKIMRSRAEPEFKFLNRSARASLQEARTTLASWFAHIPQEKRKDLRRRFRGSNARHAGALLELATHEILHAVSSNVQVEPELAGGRPDFLVAYRDLDILVECTVVNDSDARIGATQVENEIKDIVEAAYSGHFDLIVETRERGNGHPSTRRLRKDLEAWTASIPHREALRELRDGKPLNSWLWSERGWGFVFYAVPIDPEDSGGEFGMEVSPAEEVTTDLNLWHALERKASKYESVGGPYVIVIGDNTNSPDPESIVGALFGPKMWVLGSGYSYETWSCQRFFGSPSRPRNRHVSAVLYKQRFRHVGSVCEADRQWQLYHHPEAENPLPRGLFPFSIERFLQNGKPSETEPSCTLNALLGLPAPWPGTDH